MRVAENKTDLFNYLSNTVMSKLDVPNDCDLYMTFNNTVIHVGSSAAMSFACDHEEADTNVLHALATKATSVLVRTVDTDIVILAHHFFRFEETQESCKIFVSIGTGKDTKILDNGSLCNSMVPADAWHFLFGFLSLVATQLHLFEGSRRGRPLIRGTSVPIR